MADGTPQTEAQLVHIAQGQEQVLAKLDQISLALAEIHTIVSPAAAGGGESLREVLAQLVAIIERQAQTLEQLSNQTSRLEEFLLPREGQA